MWSISVSLEVFKLMDLQSNWTSLDHMSFLPHTSMDYECIKKIRILLSIHLGRLMRFWADRESLKGVAVTTIKGFDTPSRLLAVGQSRAIDERLLPSLMRCALHR